MKTSLKIFLLAAAIVMMSGCSAQKRAERHMRKAVALCPELVQLKAHTIDTTLTAPGFADCAVVPLPNAGETIYTSTDHGTVMVSRHNTDSALRVAFVAAPQKVRYTDSFSYSQVAMPDNEPRQSESVWKWVFCITVGVLIGMVLLLIISLKAKIYEVDKNT